MSAYQNIVTWLENCSKPSRDSFQSPKEAYEASPGMEAQSVRKVLTARTNHGRPGAPKPETPASPFVNKQQSNNK